MKFYRLSLLGYLVALHIMINTEHYHIFWKSVISLVILIVFHLSYYFPAAKVHHQVNNLQDLITKIRERVSVEINNYNSPQKKNRLVAIYIIWDLIHFSMWTFANPTIGSKKMFFPFHKENEYIHGRFIPQTVGFQSTYDWTEFLFYAIVPVLIYYALLLWNKPMEE
jgi:hypothetical protein